jgi:hypothetical protein
MPEQKWTQTDWDSCLRDATGRALVTIGMFIVGEAMVRTPIDTGRLVGSITWATDKKKSAVMAPATGKDAVDNPSDEWTLHVGTAVKYAPHVEYGTRMMGMRSDIATRKTLRAHTATKAQPYLRPALDENRDRAQEIYSKAIQGAIRRHGK